MTTDQPSYDATLAQHTEQPEQRSGALTLDALAMLAGPCGAVLYEPDGHHTVVRDLADLHPISWVP